MTRTARITTCTLASVIIPVFLACGGSGGGGGATTASSLTYTDPTGTSYRLLRDPVNSTGSHLILNLVGPASTELSGVGFLLTADASKATWAVINNGQYVGNAVFATPLVESKVKAGELQAGVYQRGNLSAFTTDAASVLATVALDLQPNLNVGTAIMLAAPAGRALIQNKPGSTTASTPITIEVGTLTVN